MLWGIVPQIAIIPSIIPANQMAERRFAVAPRGPLTQHLGPVNLADLFPQLVVRLRDLEGFDGRVVRRFVHGHVEDAEVQLAQVEQGVVDVLGLDEVGNQLVRDFLGRFRSRAGVVAVSGLFLPCLEILGRERGVVFAERFQLRRRPAPVLQHLAGRLDEVADGVCAVEARVGGA